MCDSTKDNIIHKNDPKYVDLLDEDIPVSGQKFVCLSFISPEKILKQKEEFYFSQFLKQYDLSKSLEKFTQFINFVSFKYKLDFDKLSKDLKEFTEEEKDNLYKTTLSDEYKNYVDNHEDSLETKFNELHNFQTSTRGLKVRGSYPSQQEAELRCKMLREMDPNHDVFVGPVGMWVPWDPEPYKTGKVEYLEEELNQLMSEKAKNEKHAKEEFQKRIKETREKAIEENIEKATESGNVLTQTLNSNGELVNVKNINTTENSLFEKGIIDSESIKKELFTGENVVTDKDTDHGLSRTEFYKEQQLLDAEQSKIINNSIEKEIE